MVPLSGILARKLGCALRGSLRDALRSVHLALVRWRPHTQLDHRRRHARRMLRYRRLILGEHFNRRETLRAQGLQHGHWHRLLLLRLDIRWHNPLVVCIIVGLRSLVHVLSGRRHGERHGARAPDRRGRHLGRGQRHRSAPSGNHAVTRGRVVRRWQLRTCLAVLLDAGVRRGRCALRNGCGAVVGCGGRVPRGGLHWSLRWSGCWSRRHTRRPRGKSEPKPVWLALCRILHANLILSVNCRCSRFVCRCSWSVNVLHGLWKLFFFSSFLISPFFLRCLLIDVPKRDKKKKKAINARLCSDGMDVRLFVLL